MKTPDRDHRDHRDHRLKISGHTLRDTQIMTRCASACNSHAVGTSNHKDNEPMGE